MNQITTQNNTTLDVCIEDYIRQVKLAIAEKQRLLHQKQLVKNFPSIHQQKIPSLASLARMNMCETDFKNLEFPSGNRFR
jgi:hypothetical protein